MRFRRFHERPPVAAPANAEMFSNVSTKQRSEVSPIFERDLYTTPIRIVRVGWCAYHRMVESSVGVTLLYSIWLADGLNVNQLPSRMMPTMLTALWRRKEVRIGANNWQCSKQCPHRCSQSWAVNSTSFGGGGAVHTGVAASTLRAQTVKGISGHRFNRFIHRFS